VVSCLWDLSFGSVFGICLGIKDHASATSDWTPTNRARLSSKWC